MDWINKIAWFFVALMCIAFGWLLLQGWRKIVSRFFQRIGSKLRLMKALAEASRIRSGQTSAAHTTFLPQAGGGMIIRHFNAENALLKEERFTPREWEQEKKVLGEVIRKNLKTKNPP